jgi:hypothetical protein
MSAGPIKQWRDSYLPPRVTTKPRESVHAPGLVRGRTYCGRRTDTCALGSISAVTCSDCVAALTADLLA